jgi:predicted DNA-binding transcriptional regulator AlpA
MRHTAGNELVTVAEVKTEFKVRSSTTIWAWVQEGILPQPHHLRQRAVWTRAEIDAARAKLLTPPRAA